MDGGFSLKMNKGPFKSIAFDGDAPYNASIELRLEGSKANNLVRIPGGDVITDNTTCWQQHNETGSVIKFLMEIEPEKIVPKDAGCGLQVETVGWALLASWLCLQHPILGRRLLQAQWC